MGTAGSTTTVRTERSDRPALARVHLAPRSLVTKMPAPAVPAYATSGWVGSMATVWFNELVKPRFMGLQWLPRSSDLKTPLVNVPA